MPYARFSAASLAREASRTVTRQRTRSSIPKSPRNPSQIRRFYPITNLPPQSGSPVESRETKFSGGTAAEEAEQLRRREDMAHEPSLTISSYTLDPADLLREIKEAEDEKAAESTESDDLK